jgi:hypothetical protein
MYDVDMKKVVKAGSLATVREGDWVGLTRHSYLFDCFPYGRGIPKENLYPHLLVNHRVDPHLLRNPGLHSLIGVMRDEHPGNSFIVICKDESGFSAWYKVLTSEGVAVIHYSELEKMDITECETSSGCYTILP